ncbi:MAG: ATP-binding protein [Armatimonadota bacterium]|nr:ATP-binding protein [Armatimonadota bacterium]
MTHLPRRRDIALVVPGETDYLSLVRDVITAVARKMGFAEERVGEIEIAVDEACANIIEHAYGADAQPQQVVVEWRPDTPPLSITLRVSVFFDRIEVRITDAGPHFSLEEIPDLDVAAFLTSGRRRGIGRYLIRQCMDEVSHRYIDGEGNELLLVKYLRGKSSG